MEEIKVADSRAIEVVAREPDPKLSENALRVLVKRYLKKDDKGRVIEAPKELFARVAWNLAQAEHRSALTEVPFRSRKSLPETSYSLTQAVIAGSSQRRAEKRM